MYTRNETGMAQPEDRDGQGAPPGAIAARAARPGQRASDGAGWAPGLKQLYDAVLEEPLPDALRDLLARLDQNPPK